MPSVVGQVRDYPQKQNESSLFKTIDVSRNKFVNQNDPTGNEAGGEKAGNVNRLFFNFNSPIYYAIIVVYVSVIVPFLTIVQSGNGNNIPMELNAHLPYEYNTLKTIH